MLEVRQAEDDVVTEPISTRQIPLLSHIELMFFAYRDFTADADRVLERFGFGRAHHRALYFVSRRPGLTVAELISILDITKQSLSRVLRQLIDSGHIRQIEGQQDRRQRLLYPTSAGHALILELSAPQSRRIEAALRDAGLSDDGAVAAFMRGMMNPETRRVAMEGGMTEDREE